MRRTVCTDRTSWGVPLLGRSDERPGWCGQRRRTRGPRPARSSSTPVAPHEPSLARPERHGNGAQAAAQSGPIHSRRDATRYECDRFASVPRVPQDAVKQGEPDEPKWTAKGPRTACIGHMRTHVHKRRASGGQVVAGANPVSPTQFVLLSSIFYLLPSVANWMLSHQCPISGPAELAGNAQVL